MYDVYSEFDIDKHQETFVNYLEVIVRADGTVEYAVPSHQMKLEFIGAEQRGMTRDDFIHTCPKQMWLDYTTWLLGQTGCIAVWSNFVKANTITEEQAEVLDEFRRRGLLKDGQIH